MRQTERADRHRDRKPRRQRVRETQRLKDTEIERLKDRESERQRNTETERQRDSKTESQRDRETKRHKNRETQRQSDTKQRKGEIKGEGRIIDNKITNFNLFRLSSFPPVSRKAIPAIDEYIDRGNLRERVDSFDLPATLRLPGESLRSIRTLFRRCT